MSDQLSREQSTAKEWRCFHCDAVFTKRSEAREHFGDLTFDPKAGALVYDAAECRTRRVGDFERLRQRNIERQRLWCPDPNNQPDMMFRSNELGGETGEAQNVVKKLERERHGWAGSRDTVEHLAEELADVIITADLLAQLAGIDLWKAVQNKFNATSEKHGFEVKL